MKAPIIVLLMVLLFGDGLSVLPGALPTEAPVVTITVVDSKAIEASFTRGPADWDDLGIFELRRTGSPQGTLKVFFEVAGTAKRQEDYVLLPGEEWFPCGCLRPEIDFRDNAITIPDGTLLVYLGVRARPDGAFEGGETVIVRLLNDTSGNEPPLYSLGNSRSGMVTIGDERPLLDLNIYKPDEGTLRMSIARGSLVNGQWHLELSHDLKAWKRIGNFSPGAVAAFAQDSVPPGDFRPRFYRAVLNPP